MDLGQFIIQNFNEFLTYTAFANATVGNLIMIAVGAFFIWLAIKKDFEPLLLVPIGLGIILGNIPCCSFPSAWVSSWAISPSVLTLVWRSVFMRTTPC